MPSLRAAFGIVLALLVLPATGAAATGAAATGEPLIFVDRMGRDDLATLDQHGVLVFHESNAGFVARASEAERVALRGLGFTLAVIDQDGRSDGLAVLAKRPETNIESLREEARLLLERENWMLVRFASTEHAAAHPGASCLAGTVIAGEPLVPPRTRVFAPPSLRGANDALEPLPLIQKMVNGVDEAKIDQYWVEITDNPPTGTRYSLSQGCRDASDYSRGVFEELGIPVEFHEWSAADAPNVVATREGAIRPDRIAIVLGHLDDLPSSGTAPGANDNGSGSVNVLEAARAMNCYAFRNTVRYLHVTGEEQGLKGSRAYATAAFNRGDDIIAAVNMDMIGWEGDGIPSTENVDINFNGPSQWLGELFRDASIAYDTGAVVDAFFCPSLTASDHQAFWEKGYDAICGITDNENYCGRGGNYPYYHQSTDTIENNGDPSLFYGVVRTSVATLAHLAEPFKVTFDRGAYAPAGTVRVVLGDADLDTVPTSVETVDLLVTSTSEPGGELVTLTERALSSMLFDGDLPLTASPATAGDGQLSVAPGDTLSVSYVDTLDCDGATGVTYEAQAVIDGVAPAIAELAETDITDTAATIRWTTNEPATSSLLWGPVKPPQNESANADLVTEHAVTLQGLEPCTVYWYEVRSSDEAGNLAVSNDAGRYHYFETLGDFGDGLVACHAGRVSLEADAFSCADQIEIKLTDIDINASPDVADTVTVVVTSTTEPSGEPLTLTETGPNTSTFTGAMATASGAPATDGVLQTSGGDLLTASYRDADDGTGRAASSYDTALADCSGPAITGVTIEPIDHARVRVRFDTSEPGTTIVDYGPTPALGSRLEKPLLESAHTIVLSDADICDEVFFAVRSADAFGHESSLGAASPLRFQMHGIPGLYWRDGFEFGAAGWTLAGEWQSGVPQGQGGSSGAADPTAAYNRGAVLGHDLTGLGTRPGDYESNITENAWTPYLDATTWESTRLIYYRKLVTGAFDNASVWLQTSAGRPIWSSDNAALSDPDYVKQSFDIGIFADGFPALRVRFEQKSNASGFYSGWNLDEVVFKDSRTPDHAACGGCAVAPGFAGATLARDEQACAAGGVRISWDEAPAWGSGTSGTYAIYRGTDPLFVPSPATLVAAGVAGTTYVDGTAPAGEPVFYIVRAENDETCAAGPANGGVIDGNLQRVSATDTLSQLPAAAVADVMVRRVGEAHVRLDWDESAGAASYRVLRAASPEPGAFAPAGETAGAFWEDEGAAADGGTHFYLVRGVDLCGGEGP